MGYDPVGRAFESHPVPTLSPQNGDKDGAPTEVELWSKLLCCERLGRPPGRNAGILRLRLRMTALKISGLLRGYMSTHLVWISKSTGARGPSNGHDNSCGYADRACAPEGGGY